MFFLPLVGGTPDIFSPVLLRLDADSDNMLLLVYKGNVLSTRKAGGTS